MFKKILVPTDGSALSTATAHAGVEFARHIGAAVVAVHVAPEYRYPMYSEIIPPDLSTQEGHEAEMRRIGQMYLAAIEKAAINAGVRFSGETAISDQIAQQIVSMADKNQCDLIFMGSHGRSGWQQLLLGSVASKVLAISQTPVLVYRSRQNAGTRN